MLYQKSYNYKGIDNVEKQRIAFIDSDIDLNFIKNDLVKGRHSIGGVWRILNDRVITSTDPSLDILSHATLCTKVFLDHTTCMCELFFVNIWDEGELKANINDLVTALTWCLENEIKLINLSLGTTLMVDIPPLFDIIDKLIERDVIIVAASSNSRLLTFPASFDNVIGVKALESKEGHLGFIYQEGSIDQIEISCYVKEEVIEYQGYHYPLCAANSLAAPIISAKICSLLSEGYDSIERVKSKLKEESLSLCHNQDDKIYKKYFEQEIEIPVIAVVNDCYMKSFNVTSFVEQLLMAFAKKEYHGICLSENGKTNLSQKVLNLTDFEIYTTVEKLRFYTRYCNVDYIIVEGHQEFLLESFKGDEIDIILHHSELDFKGKSEITTVAFSGSEDFEKLFNQLYCYLSGE